MAGGYTYGAAGAAPGQAAEFSNAMFRGEGILDSQVGAGSSTRTRQWFRPVLPLPGRKLSGCTATFLGEGAGTARPACLPAPLRCQGRVKRWLLAARLRSAALAGPQRRALAGLMPPPCLLLQDVDTGKPANPLYETNQSQLSAPDDAVYVDAGRAAAPASVPNSTMSARSRQVRACRPAWTAAGSQDAVAVLDDGKARAPACCLLAGPPPGTRACW